MKMTRKEVLELIDGIKASQRHAGAEFGFAMALNLEACERERRGMEAAVRPSEAFKAYETERINLCNELADKDEKGEPKRKITDAPPGTPPGSLHIEYVGVATHPEWPGHFEALQQKHAEALAERDKQMADAEKMLLEEVDIELEQVKFSDLPKNMTGAEIASLRRLIIDDRGKK